MTRKKTEFEHFQSIIDSITKIIKKDVTKYYNALDKEFHSWEKHEIIHFAIQMIAVTVVKHGLVPGKRKHAKK